MSRKSTIHRKTNETDITVSLNLDGNGKCNADTGIKFFDHMLSGFARHGLFDLDIKCDGDIWVDCHHTIEDAGIVLGEAICEALGEKKQITRFGDCFLPMDESLVLCAVDIGGRPYFVYDVNFRDEKCGDMDTQMVREFFYAMSYAARMNIHLKEMYGQNDHHVMEACFKAFGRALSQACAIDERVNGIPSTKGVL